MAGLHRLGSDPLPSLAAEFCCVFCDMRAMLRKLTERLVTPLVRQGTVGLGRADESKPHYVIHGNI